MNGNPEPWRGSGYWRAIEIGTALCAHCEALGIEPDDDEWERMYAQAMQAVGLRATHHPITPHKEDER